MGAVAKSYNLSLDNFRSSKEKGLVRMKRFALVRREWEAEGSGSQCCRGDEGRPLEVGMQKLASNQAVLLCPKGTVVSDC